jgi:GT2 family glycosyltransferase
LAYANWIRQYDQPSAEQCQSMREEISTWAGGPLLAIIIPVTDADGSNLRSTVGSVRAQPYGSWEIILSADAKACADVEHELAVLPTQDPRVRVVRRPNNATWLAQANAALSLSVADFVAFIRPGDTLSRDALYWIAREIILAPDCDLIFSDEDQVDRHGVRSDPWFKPDWNPALMLSHNAFGQLGIYRRGLLEIAGRFRWKFEESAQHDLVLRCSSRTSPDRIRHIARILYHRFKPNARTVTPDEREAGRRAIEEHLVRTGASGKARTLRELGFQVTYQVPSPPPPVSVIIATTAQSHLLERCLDSLRQTTYESYEVLLLVNESHRALPERAELLSRVAGDRIKVLAYPDQPFNYSRVNNWGAERASGTLLCFLNDDTELVTPEWLDHLVARVSLDRVAAAGPMLYFPDQTIQHSGVILGLGGVAGHACVHEPRGSRGYFGRGCLEQDVSCVTAACMLVRGHVFGELNGFDEELPVAYNDVDLCIRIRKAGWRILWTPAVELIHQESASLGRHDSKERAWQHLRDIRTLRGRWAPAIDADPFYNRNLSLERQYELAFPPR